MRVSGCGLWGDDNCLCPAMCVLVVYLPSASPASRVLRPSSFLPSIPPLHAPSPYFLFILGWWPRHFARLELVSRVDLALVLVLCLVLVLVLCVCGHYLLVFLLFTESSCRLYVTYQRENCFLIGENLYGRGYCPV
jgi:hypothetical protein